MGDPSADSWLSKGGERKVKQWHQKEKKLHKKNMFVDIDRRGGDETVMKPVRKMAEMPCALDISK